MKRRYFIDLVWGNFLFWLSRKINYPLMPPDTVQVNFTLACNLRCKMCNVHNHMEMLKNKGERTEVDSNTFRKIIRESAAMGIKNIFFVGGEPFIREDLFDLVRFAKHLGLTATIITNGILLNRDIIQQCFESEVDWLSISIDAASEGNFSRIRGENVLGTIIENITNLNFLKEKQNLIMPRIAAICTIMNDNLEELLDIISLCKKLKIDNISFQPVVINNVNPSIRDFCSSEFIPPTRFSILDQSIDELINYKMHDPNFISNSIKHLILIKNYFRRELSSKNVWPCYAGYNRLQIGQEYVVSFCIPPNNQYKGSFGDVSKDSLKDLWYSKNSKIRRRLIKRCNTPCIQSCSYRYQFTKLSEFIRSFINKWKNENKVLAYFLKNLKDRMRKIHIAEFLVFSLFYI